MMYGDAGVGAMLGMSSSQREAIRTIKTAMLAWVEAVATAEKDSGATVESIRARFLADYPLPEDAYEAAARYARGMDDSAFPDGIDPAKTRATHDANVAMVRKHALTWADLGPAP